MISFRLCVYIGGDSSAFKKKKKKKGCPHTEV